VFNLDTAVVLRTPLYVRLAPRLAVDPVAYAFQPALLAAALAVLAAGVAAHVDLGRLLTDASGAGAGIARRRCRYRYWPVVTRSI